MGDIDTNVTTLRPRAKTAAERMRRFRERNRSTITAPPAAAVTVTLPDVTLDRNGVTPAVTSLDTVTVRSRRAGGAPGPRHAMTWRWAGQLIIALVRRLPADAVIMLADDAPQRTVRAHLIANA